MRTIANPKNWKHVGVCSVDLAKIVLSNVGLARNEPDYDHIYDHCAGLFEHLWDTQNRLIVRNVANIVESGPAIYVANHVMKSDALMVAYTVYLNTDGRQLHIMMRDDFFGDKRWSRTPFLDMDDLARSLGAIQVSREAGAYSQVKRFVRLLVDDGCFIIFPTGTRSRSGHVMEVPPPLELGKVSFFAATAQRERYSKGGRNVTAPVAMVPTGISFNPISKKTTLVFGEAVYLEPDRPDKKVPRTVLNEFDHELLRLVSRLVEINLVQLAALYLLHYVWHAGSVKEWHGQGIYLRKAVFKTELAEIARTMKQDGSLLLGDSLDSEFSGTFKRVEKLFTRRDMVEPIGDALLLHHDRILAAPPVDREYRKRNPVKYFANQIAHFQEIVSLVEERVLRTVGAERRRVR
jgi:1-acyl-sn-glycerol-3-phosphate acyltransferase